MFVPCPLIICSVSSGFGGRCSSRPASYVVVREWFVPEHEEPTEENEVSTHGFDFSFSPFFSVVFVPCCAACSCRARAIL